MKPLEFLGNMAATGVTLMRGIASAPAPVPPARPLVLYDMEGCPWCRLVRESLTQLDLDVLVRPCPKGGLRFRPLAREQGGREQFPYLVDPNTGVALYESAAIIDYLHATYGGGEAPSSMRRRLLHVPGSFAASALRAGHGLQRRASRAPAEPLRLWSFEGSPFARPVREVLCELELPWLLHNAGRTVWQDWLLPPVRDRLLPDYRPAERNRRALLDLAGRVQVPYLLDPNTGTGLFESSEILTYLERTYGRSAE